jgi:uncharacterized circularly permuted ATP-grasp superfamily protein
MANLPDQRTATDDRRASTPALVGVSGEYDPQAGYVDELFAAPGVPHEHAGALVSTLDRMGRLTLTELGRRRDELFRQQGITFAISDRGEAERPFPLDLVPRLIPAADWESSSGAWLSACAP